MAEPIEKMDDDNETQEKEKGKSIIPILLTILRYIAVSLVIGVFVVVVTVVTVRAVTNQTKIQNSGQLSIDIQQNVPEELDWYSAMGDIRGNLLDELTVTFIVDLYIGYTPGDQAVLVELSRRNVQIKERIMLYFSSQYESDLQGARNFVRIKNELREIINRMMNNKIREVSFNNLQIIPFQ